MQRVFCFDEIAIFRYTTPIIFVLMSTEKPAIPPSEEAVRLQHLEAIRAAGLEPYPTTANRTHTLLEAKNLSDGTNVVVAGRIVGKRLMGKLCFAHLKDASGKLQIAATAADLDAKQFSFFTDVIDVGDFISVEGERFTTHKGEASVKVRKFTVLSKALLPLPEKWHGLTDIEQRYRQRYLDLIANEDSMRIAVLRSTLVKTIRNYFDNKGFYEVETPVLQTLYGGALAKPFVTHHNALDIELYLRIAPELYLKRLIVGGFEKVYEVSKCFRNEGIDHDHNPEFTQIEFYWAYANYTDLMDLMEDLIPQLLKAAGLELRLTIGDKTVDFTPPYPRVSMRELIKQYAKLDIEDCPDQKTMFAAAKKLKIEDIDENLDRGTLIDEIYKKYARPFIVNPIFMIDHPVELSPLAKRKPSDTRYVERFQLLCIGGNELCNAFTELNDPLDQEARFKEQVENREQGNEESMPYDEDFVTALKHGMPPTAGLGMGIDRLVKLLVDAKNLKEVILFPTLKPEHSGPASGKAKETMVAHAVLLDTKDVPGWSKLNAAAHLAASLAARQGKKLLHIESTKTTDGELIPMNIQHAIMMKSATKKTELLKLKQTAEKEGFVVTCFTKEMRDSTNDLKVKAWQEGKSTDEIEFLGVLIFGKKKEVEELTKKFPLIED
jgi:lysyl-tRNA synthetase class 2